MFCILFKAQDDEAKRKLTPQGNLFVSCSKPKTMKLTDSMNETSP